MPTFRTPQTIHLPPEAVARASAFADAVLETVDYRDSRQTKKQKIRDDHFVSKVGEEAVRLVFEARQCVVRGPDYAVYSSRQKSWVADLKINTFEVAVKTQRRSAANRYDLSWTFQDSPERRDPILSMPEAWVCLVVYEDVKSDLECLVYPLRRVRQLIFEPPRLARLIGKKQAVYLATLQKNRIF
ncbi:MAG TPA: hypothetical protein VK900_01500 [Anaerolineales bacterium]|nr:hypothetical protein [Anaerolineales bacterium]